MALKLVSPGPVVVSGTKGSYAPASGSSPEGWSVWSSDGRIVPPPGLYRVTTTGVVVQKRTKDGKFVEVGDLVRIADGESIIPKYATSEDAVMVERVSPPTS
nr:MAG TPA: Disulfide bond isomerase protein N-terminus [Caudoviricetes sp.]